MSNIKERILGAITVMTDEDAKKVWQLIVEQFSSSWNNIETEEPDEWDLEMINEIKNNPDCKEFMTTDETMRELGL